MTAQPLGKPEWPFGSLLTVDEYLALGETEPGYTELVEGVLIYVPSPRARHGYATVEIVTALRMQLPAGLMAFSDLDVDLQLAPPDAPGFVRRPDVMVVRREAYDRVDEDDGTFRASDLVLAIEIISPGSNRTDRVAKRDEYSDAGIPHYWIVDLDRPVSLLTCHLAGAFGYADGGEHTGVFRTTEPFAFELGLDALR